MGHLSFLNKNAALKSAKECGDKVFVAHWWLRPESELMPVRVAMVSGIVTVWELVEDPAQHTFAWVLMKEVK